MAVFSVDNLTDAGLGSLRQAIADANAAVGADVVEFQAGLAGTISLSTGEMTITDELTVVGPGAAALTIDAQQSSRIFAIAESSGPVTFDGLHVTGGDSPGGGLSLPAGGAIFSFSRALLSITGSTISDNFARAPEGLFAAGGGIFAFGDVTVTDSTISGNFAIGGSGSIGGGIYVGAGDVTIINSTISGNAAESDLSQNEGGGIFSSRGDVTVTGSTISGNSVTGEGIGIGGGIHNNFGDLTITNSTISGNAASGGVGSGGGGIRAGGSVTVSSSTIALNSAINNGGIWGDDEPITIENSIIANNSVLDGTAPDLNPGIGALSVSYSLIGDNTDSGLAEAPVGMPDMNGNLIGDPGGAGIIDPLLGLLQDNGGPTETLALLAGSPAIDAGDPNFSPPPPPMTDQRGYIRIVDSGNGMVRVDMGAFEFASRRAGDANGDGLVNAGDYTAWADQFGDPGPGQSADFNSDGVVNAGDYTLWANNFDFDFGETSPAAAPLAVAEDAVSGEVESTTVAVDGVVGSAEMNWALYMLFDNLLDDETDESIGSEADGRR